MVRTKRSQPQAVDQPTKRSPRKRGHDELQEDTQGTPSKRRSNRAGAGSRVHGPREVQQDEYAFPSEEDDATAEPAMGDTPRKRGKQAAKATPRKDNTASTPQGRKRKASMAITPSGTNGTPKGETPRWKRNDRSARKKSARALIEQVVAGEETDEEVDGDISRAIYESSDEEDDAEDEEGGDDTGAGEPPDEDAATPSKKRGPPPKKTGKGARARKRSPTPPRDLPPHELYFAQNRPGAVHNKTSNNTLAALRLLTHDEYFSILHGDAEGGGGGGGGYEDPHAADVEFLQSLHARSFAQWAFELAQGFSLCLYGYGSKRALMHRFARHVHDSGGSRVVIANGYVRTASGGSLLREILGAVAAAVDPAHKLPGAGGGAAAMLDSVRALLALPRHADAAVTLVLNSVDAPPLRRAGAQAALAALAAHPRVRLACSADTPDFPLLWDAGLRSAFAFVFHDCTTFAAPSAAAELDVVDDVHELLGRRARRVGGKEGVTYVLRSLPENAKNLFRLLVVEVLAAMDEDNGGGGASVAENAGVEYRMLYNKAVEEFICSSEMAFRTLLKEFHDHQMITSRKDVLGTELLSVPFLKEETEAILEDLMS
ncbi:ORC2-domain-containing protein [Xylariaceae sp. FL0804]|nr:ORC2-domain-containing protein [Xylariaceae sp. FL0804]